MSAKFQPSSFIPKETDTGGTERKKKRKEGGGKGLLFIASVLVFVISLVLAGGAFAYNKYIEGRLDDKKRTLQEVRNSFEPELIDELSRLDRRLRVAEELMEDHVAVSPLFDLLERNTLESVRFLDFDYLKNTSDIEVSMRGVTDSYTSIALQSDVFGENRDIRNPIFSDFELDDAGNVFFNVEFRVNPELLRYQNHINVSAASGGAVDESE